LPKETLDQLVAMDKDAEALKKAAKKTGIVQKIDKINKTAQDAEKKKSGRPYSFGNDPNGYFALSPRWAFDNEKDKTKHPVMFWLNPQNQKDNNFGWYTVEELDQWINGEGPVPKEARVEA
jgi:hypothetical protein